VKRYYLGSARSQLAEMRSIPHRLRSTSTSRAAPTQQLRVVAPAQWTEPGTLTIFSAPARRPSSPLSGREPVGTPVRCW
jgi:hypothetical protein